VVSLAHSHRILVGRDEDATAHVESERTRRHASRIDVLDSCRLASLLVDRVDCDGILASSNSGLCHRAASTVGLVHKSAVGVYVDGPRNLAGSHVSGISQAVFDKQRLAAKCPVRQLPVDLELVLPLQRNEDPWSRGVKIEMPGLKT
jgi:hypothetical protein